MVTEITDPTEVGAAIQAAFLTAHHAELIYEMHYPTRVHGPTGRIEFWLTFYRIWGNARKLDREVSLSAIDLRLTRSNTPVKGVQYEENSRGIQGAWG